MKQENDLGTVISRFESPSPSAVDFVVTSGIVHRGQYVELEYSEGTMIALVTDVIKTNRYFERAESVKEFESSGTELFDQFPTHEWEYLVAKTRPLGVFNEHSIKRATFPPGPGTKVRVAGRQSLERFLRFDKENGLFLGKIEHHGVEVKPSMNALLKKHLSILAMTGGGKSHTVACLIEELLGRKKEQGRIAVIALDPHGEYSSFALQPKDKTKKDYSAKTKIVRAREMKIGVPKLSVSMLANIIPGISSAQKRELERITSKLNKEMRDGLGPYGLEELKQAIIQDEEMHEGTKTALTAWVYSLHELHLFGKTDNPSIFDVVKPGQLTVVDMSDIIDLRKKQIIVSYFAQRLFFERRNKSVPPFLLVLEEAHQWIPERTTAEQSVSKGILRTIAREGRKFGASLCLVSQRPLHLDTTTLSQCSSSIILRITNPNDLDHIGESVEALDSRSKDIINSLRVGEALLVGEATINPVFFTVRQRNSMESPHEVSLEKAALDFEGGKEKQEEETGEFL